VNEVRRRRIAPRSFFVLAVLGLAGALAWHEYREPVRAAVRDYLALRRVEHYEDVLRVAAVESGVDPCLLAALMVVESSGRVGAKSSRGALGLFQLTMVSARWRAQVLGLPEPTEEALLSDPLLNARLGADNLAWLMDTYEGNVERALCAYNAGARRLKELCDEAGGWEAWRSARERTGDSKILAYAYRVLHYRDELRERGHFPEFYGPPEAEGLLPSVGVEPESGSGVGPAPGASSE